MYKLEGHSDLARDPKTNSILNVNTTEYEQYVARRSVKNEEIEKSQNVEQELADLKSEMNEIKSLLKELVNGN
jgi:uncharacterized HAD superfamily protein|tara:strand:+ start:86 stop:304 length:219 start_codon:yes stop_codon:yes gene_type:complete